MSKRGKEYWIDWYTEGGHCYKSTSGADWEGVKAARRLAHTLGETIRYHVM